MVQRRQTFSIRLAVEDGNKVKAVFVGIGKEGEQAFNKIDSGSKRASGGLGTLTKRARSLSRNIKLLGVATAAVATIGGLALLTKKSIDAASALGKSAEQMGVNVEALQEYRFVAQAAGIEQDRFDTGLKTFTKRTAEAARGTGQAKDALKEMGISLHDSNGNLRTTETLLDEVADALQNTEDPAKRLQLAFRLFDSEGAAFVKVLGSGSAALEKTRQQARDLGIVLDKDLIRDAEKAKTELEVLSKVVSANLSRALLGLAPLIADTSSLLAELAADAGNAYEKMLLIFQGDFAFENQSLRGLNQDLKNFRDEIEKIDADLKRRRALQEKGGLGAFFGGATEVDFIFHEQRRADIVEKIAATEKRISAIRAEREALEGSDTPDSLNEPDIQALLKQEQELQNLTKSLDKQLFDLTTKGAERIRVETDQLVEQIKTLKDIASEDEIAGLIKQAREVESLQLAEFTEKKAQADEKAREAAERRTKAEKLKADTIKKANQSIVEGLNNEIAALGKSERQNFIDQATRRLSAEATETQRIEVERLASALFDEREAVEAVRKEHEREAQIIENIVNLTDEQTDAQARYNKEIEELNRLRKEEKITAQQLAVAEEDARRRMLAASRRWIDGVERALRDYSDQATDSARQAEDVTLNFLRNAEDAFTEFAQTGKFEFRDLLNSIVADINRALVQQNITGPLAQGLNSIIGSIDFGSLFGSAKGNVFSGGAPVQAFARGGVVNKPTTFPMTNGIGLMGEAGPEAILPLRRLPSGKLGVESAGNSQPMFTVNVDARGSTDPSATAAQVEQAVDRALSARVPGIIRASSTTAKAEVIDAFQRRGGRFD